MGDCICGLAVREGKMLFSRNIHSDLRCTLIECRQAGIRSFAAIPLRTGEGIIGVIGLASLTDRDFELQSAFLETLAHQISVAMANARLYEAAQRELSERKRAEESLRRSEKRFQNLLQNIPSVAVQGYGPDGTTQYWNQTSERLYGYRKEEAIGHNLLALIIPPEMREKVTREIQWMADTGKPIPPSELSLMRKDGSRVAVFSSHAVVKIPGRPPELFCFDIDLTEQKRMEREHEDLESQNRQLQKAESLSRMAGAIAHHFNNQLMVVMGNLEMALLDLTRDDIQFAKLSEAMKATHKAREVSSLMLTYLGQTTGKKAPTDICELCRQNLPLFRATLPETIHLETDLPIPGPTIHGITNQIWQVVTNLITNAGESCTGGGNILLRIKTVGAEEIPRSHRHPINWQPQSDRHACLEIADSGFGIDEKDIEKIFDPFFTSKFTGRGLGLAVVLGILRGHGGAIAVESEPGRGSIFRVFLPESAETSASAPPE